MQLPTLVNPKLSLVPIEPFKVPGEVNLPPILQKNVDVKNDLVSQINKLNKIVNFKTPRKLKSKINDAFGDI